MDTQDEARFRDSEVTFRYTIENVSKLKNTQISPPCYVQNLPWKILVQSNQDKSIGFFLQCNGESESDSWSCFANSELRLLSRKEGQTKSLKIRQLFKSGENSWGFSNFIKWKDVIDPTNSYIKDDTITLEAYVKAEPPHGISRAREVKSKADFRVTQCAFRYVVKNVSLLRRAVLSPPCYVQTLPWRMLVECYEEKGTVNKSREKWLGFFLQCDEENKHNSWSCHVDFELRLLSCKKGQTPVIRKLSHLFSYRESALGFDKFMAFLDVLDPANGYIKDDTITLEVYMKADLPFGV